ncbi:hypothetical protein BBK36DRAFT_1126751 [Trichoderma citrinoviride]|uniref:Uncharacterized protein n=1 Tax=Trichoderma citrinoviride TaxID=58853 RepID=A0A2T4B2P0_9HYPO|nr:hypothetical protein BBK36DRAFT_1126751 [Trichoderma citrinoviride]PTB63595.1 hypothetical protein BBK36DRAFT_1126751 [Trichoderma citrinoviride]
MPHKHRSKKGDNGAEFDLPPTENARPLPVKKRNATTTSGDGVTKKRQKISTRNNDTPRAFRRLMAVAAGKKLRSGLDDGRAEKSTKGADKPSEDLQIRPGENLGAFASRVDAALPVSGLARKTSVNKDGKDAQGFKVYRTRKERKMHKLYEQWRAEELKIQERKEEELERIAERDLEDDAAGILTSVAFQNENSQGKRKKGHKRRKAAEEDPWLELKKRRAEKKPKIYETVLAPPEFSNKG